MNVGLVVDSTCDLPSSILERYNVNVLPTTIAFKSESYVDERSKEASLKFYGTLKERKLGPFKIDSMTPQSFVDALEESLLYQYDHLLVIAPHLKLNNTLNAIRQGIIELQPEIMQLRQAAHLNKSFKIRVIESNTGYAGYGLALYEALRLMGEKAQSADQLKVPLDRFKKNITTHLLPGAQSLQNSTLTEAPFNMGWLALKKCKLAGQHPVFTLSNQGIETHSFVQSANATNDFLGKVYDELTRNKLKNHLVNISYAGHLSHLRVLPTFKALHEHVKSKGGKMVHSVMSPVNGIKLGPGALSIAFATRN